MVYSTALEMRRPERDREFESHPLRKTKNPFKGFLVFSLSGSGSHPISGVSVVRRRVGNLLNLLRVLIH